MTLTKFSFMQNTHKKIRESTNDGTDIPINEYILKILSMALSLYTAQSIPRGTETATVIPRDMNVISSVVPIWDNISSETGFCLYTTGQDRL